MIRAFILTLLLMWSSSGYTQLFDQDHLTKRGKLYKRIFRGQYPVTLHDFGLEPGTKRVVDYHGSLQATSLPHDYTITTEFSKTGKLLSTSIDSYHFPSWSVNTYNDQDQLIKYTSNSGGDSVIYFFDVSGRLDRTEHYYASKNEFMYSTRFIYEQLGDTLTVYEVWDKYHRSRSSVPECLIWQFVFNDQNQLVYEKSSYYTSTYLTINNYKYEYDSKGDLATRRGYKHSDLVEEVWFQNGVEVEAKFYTGLYNYKDSIELFHFRFLYDEDSSRTEENVNYVKYRVQQYAQSRHFGIPVRNRLSQAQASQKKRDANHKNELEPKTSIGILRDHDFSTISFEYY